MNNNYILKQTLYYNEFADSITDCPDYCNGKLEDGCRLFARKGQIAKKVLITKEVRDEYNIDNMYVVMYTFTNGKYVLFQEQDA